MKYWILTSEFPPIHGGGISTYCWHTAQMFAEKGHDVTVFTQDFSVQNVKEEQPFKGCRLIRFRPDQLAQSACLGYEARLSYELSCLLEKYIEKEGPPDYIETQDYMGIGYYTLLKKHLLYSAFKNVPIILTIHAPGFLYLEYNQAPQYKFPEFWYGEMEKSSIRMADILISPSNYIVDQLKTRMSFKDIKATRVFNPFIPLSKQTTDFERNNIAFFGKLTPQKGCLEMFEYFSKMWDKGFSQPLRIIGGGEHFFYPQQMDMIDFIKKKYHRHVSKGLISFEGNIPPEKLKERLAKAHVIITPSIVDNLPYAVLEAMSLGKVVLSSEDGGHTEILKDDSSGFIFSHRDKNSFEKKLKYILSLDKERIIEIGKKAQEEVDKNTNYSTVYEKKIQLINSYKPSSNQFNYNRPIQLQNIQPTKSELEKGKLSVVIPFYNLGNYVEETVVSILESHYKKVEILIINDGSSNKSDLTILETLEKKYPVKVFNKENSGLSDTRNFGAKLAKGEFLAFLDADDTIQPEYYTKAIEILTHYQNVHFVGCWAKYFEASSDTWPTFNPEPPYLCVHNMINSSALVYKTQSFLNFGLNDSRFIYGMEDYDSLISMVKNGARGVSIPETYWNYRIRPNSMQQSFNRDKELYLYRLLADKHSDFFSDYANEIAHLLNYNGPGISYDNPTWNVAPNSGMKLPEFNGRLFRIVKRNPILRKIGKKVYNKIFN